MTKFHPHPYFHCRVSAVLLAQPRIRTMCPPTLRCPRLSPRLGDTGGPGRPRPAGVAQDVRGLRSRVPSPPQTPLRFFLLLPSAAKIMHFLESGRVHFPALKCIQSFAARCQMSPAGSRGAPEPGLAPCPGEPGVGSSKTPGKSTPAYELSCCIQPRDGYNGTHSAEPLCLPRKRDYTIF